MAKARRGVRLIRRPPVLLRALRTVAAAVLVGLIGLVGYESLRARGFEFRWETEVSGSRSSPRALRDVPIIAAVPKTRGAPLAPSSVSEDSLEFQAGHPTPVENARVLSTALVPPAVNDSVAAGTGAFASIDFASFSDGGASCTNCPVRDEWASDGVRLSFRSWTSNSDRPFVLDARNFLPDGASMYALGPALRGAQGLEVGVVRLDFPGRPRKVAFTLYGPDLIHEFDVVAWSGTGILGPSPMTRSLVRRYRPAGRGLFRSERILIEWAAGIDRVSLDGWGPPGHVLLVDDLALDP